MFPQASGSFVVDGGFRTDAVYEVCGHSVASGASTSTGSVSNATFVKDTTRESTREIPFAHFELSKTGFQVSDVVSVRQVKLREPILVANIVAQLQSSMGSIVFVTRKCRKVTDNEETRRKNVYLSVCVIFLLLTLKEIVSQTVVQQRHCCAPSG